MSPDSDDSHVARAAATPQSPANALNSLADRPLPDTARMKTHPGLAILPPLCARQFRMHNARIHRPSTCLDRTAVAPSGSGAKTGRIDFPIRSYLP